MEGMRGVGEKYLSGGVCGCRIVKLLGIVGLIVRL